MSNFSSGFRVYKLTPEQFRADWVKRFHTKYEAGPPDACWLWQAGTRGGYGIFAVPTFDFARMRRGPFRLQGAHRVAWELHHQREIPEGMVIMHTCDVPGCVNPAHLRLGTQADNMADRDRKGRNGRKGKPGEPKKLTADQVREIRARVAAGDSQRSVAREYGVSQPLVNHIVHRRVWAHVD